MNMTSRKALFVLAVAAGAFIAGFGVAAHMISTGGEEIPRDVVNGGGGRSEALSGHVLEGSIGQPITGISQATNGTTLVGGFQVMTPRSASQARRWQMYY
jgi:hypothetical protein